MRFTYRGKFLVAVFQANDNATSIDNLTLGKFWYETLEGKVIADKRNPDFWCLDNVSLGDVVTHLVPYTNQEDRPATVIVE